MAMGIMKSALPCTIAVGGHEEWMLRAGSMRWRSSGALGQIASRTLPVPIDRSVKCCRGSLKSGGGGAPPCSPLWPSSDTPPMNVVFSWKRWSNAESGGAGGSLLLMASIGFCQNGSEKFFAP